MGARFFFVVVSAAVFAAPAFAQADPPGRVARINYSEGAVSYAPSGDREFIDAEMNRPLVRGDKLWTDKGVRTEIQAGSAIVRMDGRTQLEVLALNDQTTQLSVTQGTVYLRVRNLPEGENFEVDTPNLAWRASYPGDYRIDVDHDRGVTRVTIHSGTGAVYGDKAQALPMGGGQQITFKGRSLAQVDAKEQPPQDNFDRWAAERNRREDQSVAARYVPRDVVGYQLLDTSGQWQQDANYGVVWIPQSVPANWAPYRNGRWEAIAPWGWTWVDDKPWGFVTSHYGRWAQINSKWAWVPGRLGVRPIYSPALVAFVGNGDGPLSVGGKQSIAWFPLAPGEAWQPGFRATPLYISSVNANMPPQAPAKYTYQSAPEALTAIAAEDFARGKPAKSSWLHVAANALTNAQVVAPPAVPNLPAPTRMARAQPSPDIKPAIDNHVATLQQQAEAQKQAQREADAEAQRHREQLAKAEQERAQREQLAKAEQARAAEQQKIAEQQKLAEQQKIAEQQAEQQRAVAAQQRIAEQKQKLADQQRIADQKQKLAEKQRAAEQQRIAEHEERAAEAQRIAAQQRALEQQQQKVAQKKAAEVARREAAEQSKRDAVLAKRAEQARRDQVTAKREQARREQITALLRERETKRQLAALQAREQREQRELQARRAQESKRLMAAAAKKDEEARRVARAQQTEMARRAAEHDAQVLAAQRTEREASIRRVAEEKERTQREAWQKQQQALAEQFKRDQQAYDEQQRLRAQQRSRPDLRRQQPGEPEVWQRGIPVLNPSGRTS